MKRRQLKRQQRSSCTESTASGWEKKLSNFFPLPPATALGKRSDCVPGRSSPAPLSGCRGSVASPWQPPPVDIPAAPAGRARLRWTAWSAHSPCSRTATDTKTQKTFVKPQHRDILLINRIHFHWRTDQSVHFSCSNTFVDLWAKTMLLMKLITCWFSYIGRVTVTMDTSAPVEF